MSGLNLTRGHVKEISGTGHFYVKDIDPLTTDWLAMHDLLKEIADDRPTCDGEINQLVKRIRVLIGGE